MTYISHVAGKAGLVLSAIIVLSGCSPTVDSRLLRPEGSLSPVRCVAVLPFDNLTRYPYAGEIAAEILSVELLRSQLFNVMERAEVERIFLTRGIVPPSSVDIAFAVEAGRILGVEGVFAGTVSEYYYRKTSRATQNEEPVVGMTIRLIEVSSSQTLWTGTITKVSGSFFLAMREPISEIALQAVEEVVHPLLAAVPLRSVDPRNICWSDPRKLLLTAYAPPPAPRAVVPPSPTPSPAEEEAPASKPAEIAVLNGSGVLKAEENIAKIILFSNLNLVSVGNAKKPHRESVVFYKRGYKNQAEKLASLLPKRVKVERTSEYTWDITVVVGKDLAKR